MLDVVQISEQWNEDEPKLNKLGAEVSSFLRKGLFTKELHPEISYRTKEIQSLIKKIQKKQKTKEYGYNDLRDKLGIRIICPFTSDLDIVDSFLKENFIIRKEEKKKDGNHDSDNHFYSSSADNTFVAFQHDDSGKGDDDEADCENIRKVSPPLSGVVVQACHCSDERAAGDRFVDCLSRTNVYLQVGPAFQEHFHDVRFREIVLGIVTFLSQWLQQSQYIFPFHSLFARQFFGNLIFFPFDGEVRVDGVTVIHHNAGNGINQDHSGKEKG